MTSLEKTSKIVVKPKKRNYIACLENDLLINKQRFSATPYPNLSRVTFIITPPKIQIISIQRVVEVEQ